MTDFPAQLQLCMSRGDLIVSDLARWFGRPRATVNTWVNGRTPYGPSGRLAQEQLNLLSWALKNKQGFPVPAGLGWKARADYIRGIRDAAERNNRVPKVRATG